MTYIMKKTQKKNLYVVATQFATKKWLKYLNPYTLSFSPMSQTI